MVKPRPFHSIRLRVASEKRRLRRPARGNQSQSAQSKTSIASSPKKRRLDEHERDKGDEGDLGGEYSLIDDDWPDDRGSVFVSFLLSALSSIKLTDTTRASRTSMTSTVD